MRQISSSETVRDALSLLGHAALRLAQAAAVTAVVAVAIMVVFPFSTCACTTKEKAYQAAMKSDLRNLVSAQEAYFGDHGAYATALDSTWFQTSAGVTVTLAEVTQTGWRAVARHQGTPKRCAIFVGDVAPPAKEAVQAEPLCWDP